MRKNHLCEKVCGKLDQSDNYLKKKLRKVNDELALTKKEVKVLRKENTELKMKSKEVEMENLMVYFKNKVDENNHENLENLLETWDEILIKNDSKFIQKHFQIVKSVEGNWNPNYSWKEKEIVWIKKNTFPKPRVRDRGRSANL